MYLNEETIILSPFTFFKLTCLSKKMIYKKKMEEENQRYFYEVEAEVIGFNNNSWLKFCERSHNERSLKNT